MNNSHTDLDWNTLKYITSGRRMLWHLDFRMTMAQFYHYIMENNELYHNMLIF